MLRFAGPGQPPVRLLELTRATGCIVWDGWLAVEDKDAALAAADIVVCPSRSEGLPVALLEAMTAGCALVVTRAGGMPEIVADGVEALLVDVEDAAGLAAAIRRLAVDAALRASLGEAAQRRAERLTEDEVLARLDGLFQDLLAGDRRRRDGATES